VSQPHTFPAQSVGYDDQSANLIYVTVTNMDDQNTGDLTVNISNSSHFYTPRNSYDGLAKGQSVKFTVMPATGLTSKPEPYGATVTVSGNRAINIRNSFAVSFTVNPASFISAPSISVTPTGTDSLRVDWSAADPAPDSYKVYWKKGNYTTPAEIRTGSSTITTVNSRTYTITGLDGASEYSVFVEAVKANYAKAESDVTTATTYKASFTDVLSLSLTGVTEDSIKYHINSSGLNPSAVESYDIYYLEGDKTAEAVLSSSDKVTVTKTSETGTISFDPAPEPDASYTVLAVAKKTGYNDSDPSNPVKVVFSPTINLTGNMGQNETYGQGWKYADDVYTILDGADVSVRGITTSRRIEAAADAAAKVTLNNAHISGITTGSAFTLNTGANVTMTLAGSSDLKTSKDGAAGIQTTGATLTIEGTGSLEAVGGSENFSGAGIGGSTGEAGGNITITGSAVVTAQGGNSNNSGGAGIGGVGGGNITITGNAVVTARGMGGYGGPGIGGVEVNIIISGDAVVTAQGGGNSNGGAGIGGGYGGAGGEITITGNALVTAQGGGLGGSGSSSYGGAGIGGGGNAPGTSTGDAGIITISGNAVVIAKGGIEAAGIGGGGYHGGGGNITIRGGTVITSKIGSGDYGTAGTINSPRDAVVFAGSASTGLTTNLSNGISVGDASIAINGAYPSFTATVTLQNDMTVPAGATLTIPRGVTLNKSGKTLTETGDVVEAGGVVNP
jgi:hypothetical protein